MASVPSAGCLLAKNQYYRSECSSGLGAACCPQTPPALLSPLPFFLPGERLRRREAEPPEPLPRKWPGWLPEVIDKYWWIKSFFHSEPSPPAVGRKTLSAS
ncbi:PDPFL protein, partial [Acrocephalus arundinaceus]|nr:PDPFL protein [Acrocephalus arundinaceus]